MKKNFFNPHLTFFIFLIFLNLILGIFATPIISLGDAPDYINMAKSLIGYTIGMNFENRSPLYSLVLAGFIKMFNENFAITFMIYLQYTLIAIASWMLYKIFLPFFKVTRYPIIIGLLFNLSFSTIYYANILITEIFTVFIFILAIYLLIKIYNSGNIVLYFLLGTILGLLVLVRYNTIPVIITFFSLLLINFYRKKIKMGSIIKSIMFLIIPFSIIINAWCVYNYHKYGFYNLFYTGGISPQPRNAIVGSIHSGNNVSEKNKPILEIFLKAREEYKKNLPIKNKGSLAFLDKFDFLDNIYDGYSIYLVALPRLKKHLKLGDKDEEYKISKELNSFYNEIKNQNKDFLLKCRFYSLLSSFRASAGGGLPAEYGTINLNILPVKIFFLYKVSIIGMSIFFWIGFFIYLFRIIRKKFRFDMTLFSLFGLTISFWAINFIFITVNDSNRFKFPTEPILFGIFVMILIKVFDEVKNFRKKLVIK